MASCFGKGDSRSDLRKTSANITAGAARDSAFRQSRRIFNIDLQHELSTRFRSVLLLQETCRQTFVYRHGLIGRFGSVTTRTPYIRIRARQRRRPNARRAMSSMRNHLCVAVPSFRHSWQVWNRGSRGQALGVGSTISTRHQTNGSSASRHR